MPTIKVSKSFYKKLLSYANSFDDTPEIVMERIINEWKRDTTIPPKKAINNNATTKKSARRNKITIKKIREIYSRARLVFEAFKKGRNEGRKELEDALDYLEEKVEMNRGSAHIYIKVFLALRRGELHKNKMSINDVAAEYFLKKILADDGSEALEKALDSLFQYIEYREKLVGGRMIVFREIYVEYSAKIL